MAGLWSAENAQAINLSDLSILSDCTSRTPTPPRDRMKLISWPFTILFHCFLWSCRVSISHQLSTGGWKGVRHAEGMDQSVGHECHKGCLWLLLKRRSNVWCKLIKSPRSVGFIFLEKKNHFPETRGTVGTDKKFRFQLSNHQEIL